MHVSPWNVAFQIVNFLVLAWLLHHFLWKPVRRTLDARRKDIARRLKEAEDEKAAAEKLVSAHRDALAAVTAEAEAERQRVRHEAEEDAARIREEAEAKARALASRTRDELARERTDALGDLTSRAADLALVVAERLLRETAPARDEPFAMRVTESIDALDPAERSALGRGLRDRGVAIVCARGLDADARARLDGWLAALAGGPVRASYAVDPRLVAGVELRFPDAVFRSDIKTALARVREELVTHGRAA